MHRKNLACSLMMLTLAAMLFFTWGAGMCAEPTQAKKSAVESARKPKAKPGAVQGKKVRQADLDEEGIASEPAAGKPDMARGKASDTSPGHVNARGAILQEVTTGTSILEYNADELIEPASFTKVLSLYLIFEAIQQGNLKLTDEILVSETAWRTGGSKMFVGVGTRVPLEELIKGIAVVSGNDACVAVAEHLYGSADAFVEAMNRKAGELGMSKSRFMNPHGLPAEGQITTARDMGTLAVAYLRRFPESLRFHSMHDYSYNNISQYNRNRLLLKDPSVDGLKTGFVGAAGYHLTATARKDGMRLVAVVMGAGTPGAREREAAKLLNYGFRQYALAQPFELGKPVGTVKVWKGMKNDLEVYAAETATFLIPQAQKKSLRWEMHMPSEITAPVAVDQQMGELVFYVSDEAKKTVALVSHDEVLKAGWLKRSWQTILRINQIDWRWFAGTVGGIALVVLLMMFIANRRSSKRSRSSFSS